MGVGVIMMREVMRRILFMRGEAGGGGSALNRSEAGWGRREVRSGCGVGWVEGVKGIEGDIDR